MPGTVTDNLTNITFAEAADSANWDDVGGGPGSGQSIDLPIYLLNDRARRIDSNERGFGFDNGTGINISAAGTHLGYWMNVLQPALINANGVEFSISDSANGCQSGNWDGHRYSQSDYPKVGGWQRVWIDLSRTREVGSGTLALTSVRNFGATFDMGNVDGTSDNCHLDRIDYSVDGLQLTGGTVPSPATWADLSSFDDTNSIGIFDGDFLDGPVTLGGSGTTIFNDKNFAIKARTQPLAATDWITITIDLTGGGSNIDMPSGSFSGIGFVFVTDEGGSNLGTVVISNAPAMSLIGGVTWSGALVASGTLTVNSATVTGMLFDGSTGTSAAIIVNTNEVDGATFISAGTGHAVDLGNVTTDTSMVWDAIATGYAGTSGTTGNETIRVNVSAGQTLTITQAAGATLPTVKNDGTGTVTIVQNQISWTLAMRDALGLALTGAEITITDTAATPNELFHVEASVTGSETYTFASGSAGNDVVVIVIPDTATDGDLEVFSVDTTLPAASVTTNLDPGNDRVYDNPA